MLKLWHNYEARFSLGFWPNFDPLGVRLSAKSKYACIFTFCLHRNAATAAGNQTCWAIMADKILSSPQQRLHVDYCIRPSLPQIASLPHTFCTLYSFLRYLGGGDLHCRITATCNHSSFGHSTCWKSWAINRRSSESSALCKINTLNQHQMC